MSNPANKPQLRYRASRAVACPGGGESREFSREVLMQSVHPEVRHNARHFSTFVFGGTVFQPIVDGKPLQLPGVRPAAIPPSSQTIHPPITPSANPAVKRTSQLTRRKAFLIGATLGVFVLAVVGIYSLAASQVSTVASPVCDKRAEVCR